MADEKYIQFIANYDDWVSIKKLKIEPATEPKTVMEFLASLNTSLDNKVESNLRKILELDRLDKVIDSLGLAKREYDKALAGLNGRDVNGAIKEITEKDGLMPNEKSELADFCKVYAARKVLKQIEMPIDYSQIKIPGMKKMKKAKA